MPSKGTRIALLNENYRTAAGPIDALLTDGVAADTYANLEGATFTGDVHVPDEAYDATNWDGSTEVPTKNAVRDKIEALTAPAGRLIGIQTITATGAGTYTPTTGTASIVIELIGGGGGSSGIASPTGVLVSIGRAAGAGAYLRKRLTTAFSGAGYVVGAKGTGGASGNNAGNNGTGTTFTATGGGGTVYTAGGGTGGNNGGSGLTAPTFSNGNDGGTATNGDINIPGTASGFGYALSATLVVGANGAPGPFGGSVIGKFVAAVNSTAAATNATGKGSSGAPPVASGTGAAQAGADGADGMIIIWEYS